MMVRSKTQQADSKRDSASLCMTFPEAFSPMLPPSLRHCLLYRRRRLPAEVRLAPKVECGRWNGSAVKKQMCTCKAHARTAAELSRLHPTSRKGAFESQFQLHVHVVLFNLCIFNLTFCRFTTEIVTLYCPSGGNSSPVNGSRSEK